MSLEGFELKFHTLVSSFGASLELLSSSTSEGTSCFVSLPAVVFLKSSGCLSLASRRARSKGAARGIVERTSMRIVKSGIDWCSCRWVLYNQIRTIDTVIVWKIDAWTKWGSGGDKSWSDMCRDWNFEQVRKSK